MPRPQKVTDSEVREAQKKYEAGTHTQRQLADELKISHVSLGNRFRKLKKAQEEVVDQPKKRTQRKLPKATSKSNRKLPKATNNEAATKAMATLTNRNRTLEHQIVLEEQAREALERRIAALENLVLQKHQRLYDSVVTFTNPSELGSELDQFENRLNNLEKTGVRELSLEDLEAMRVTELRDLLLTEEIPCRGPAVGLPPSQWMKKPVLIETAAKHLGL